jgi:hypothetical protein
MKIDIHVTALLVAVCFLGDVTKSVADATDSEKIARLASDSAAGQWSAYKEGSLHAKITVDSRSSMKAEILLTWRDADTRLDVLKWERTTRGADGVVAKTSSPVSVLLYTGKESWSYDPVEKFAYGYAGERRQVVPQELDVRPRGRWLALPYFPAKTYQKLFAGPRFHELGSEIEPGVHRFGTDQFRVTVDEKQDFLPVLTESLMYGPMKEELSSPFVASYEWMQDEHGVRYCRAFQLQEFSWDRVMLATTRVEVLAYDSQPTKEKLNFTVDGLGIQKGSRMRLADGRRSRSWNYQEKEPTKSGIYESDYQRLIESARSGGFSSRSRSAK